MTGVLLGQADGEPMIFSLGDLPPLGPAILVGTGSVVALAALSLVVLAVASFAYQGPVISTAPRSRLVVLVPAHNEAKLLRRCLATLRAQSYPRSLVSVVVIADNCTDHTASLAREAGVEVLIRHDLNHRGKGYALRWAMDQMTGSTRPDAFVVVDADSITDPGLLVALAAAYERGAQAAQAQYLVSGDDESSPRVRLRAAAFLLFHRVRFAGRAALGLPCSLVGNGMLFAGDLIERHPWNAFTGAEDLEYSVNLRMAGVRPVFVGGALVRGPVPASQRAAQRQRERWEGGRLHVVRTSLPSVLGRILHGELALADLAVDLATPPLGLLTALSAGGAILGVGLWLAGLTPAWTFAPWVIAVVAVVGYVALGLRAAGAPAQVYRDLMSAPRFLVEKLLGIAGVLRSRPAETWIRTERPDECG